MVPWKSYARAVGGAVGGLYALTTAQHSALKCTWEPDLGAEKRLTTASVKNADPQKPTDSARDNASPPTTASDKHKHPSSRRNPTNTHSHTSRVEDTLDTVTSGHAAEPPSPTGRSRSHKSHLTWSQAFASQRSLHASAPCLQDTHTSFPRPTCATSVAPALRLIKHIAMTSSVQSNIESTDCSLRAIAVAFFSVSVLAEVEPKM